MEKKNVSRSERCLSIDSIKTEDWEPKGRVRDGLEQGAYANALCSGFYVWSFTDTSDTKKKTRLKHVLSVDAENFHSGSSLE